MFLTTFILKLGLNELYDCFYELYYNLSFIFCFFFLSPVIVPQSIMVRWAPPPLSTQNGELTGYKIRYRKAGRKGDAAEIITNQLFQLLDGRFKN